MIPEKENRIIFFSKQDGSGGLNLSLAEPILRNFDSTKKYDINDIIELYQIKLYIDNEVFLTKWSEIEIMQFKETIKSIWTTVQFFWSRINNDNILELFDTLEIGYQPAFWSLTETLQIYKNISGDIFKEILNNPELWISEVLYQEKLVNFFGSIIKNYLLENNGSAELILIQYEKQHDTDHQILYFPKCLSINEKELIISNYLDNPDANLNYIHLIVNSRDTSFLKLSPRIRLKAKKVEKELNNKIFENGFTWQFGYEVSISDDQDEPVTATLANNIHKISYSRKWLNEQKDDLSLMHNFSSLFNFTDKFGFITLTSKNRELDVFEKGAIHSKNEYLRGIVFKRKSNLSHLQIFLYSNYLKQIDKSIEGILSFFIKDYFIGTFGMKDFQINLPSEKSTFLEKVRLIVPEIESGLKQFKLYAEDGIIEHELLQINSKPIIISDIPSLVDKKYAYGFGDEYKKLAYIFFSDQNTLYYVKPFQNKYKNLYSLLISENVSLENFKLYKKAAIETLILDGYLLVDSDSFVRIKDNTKLAIIGMLSNEEGISYWRFPESIRKVIDEMEVNGLVYFGQTLFTESEYKYFNYYLNKFEFTNGLDLRNKYTHGTNSDSEEAHKNEYFILLKLLVLIMLKIEDDLLIRDFLKNNKIEN